MYATPEDLLRLIGPAQLAGISRPDHMPGTSVSGALLQLTIAGGDRSAFSSAEQAAADDCLARIQLVLDQSSKQMDSYLSCRYMLPLSTGTVAANALRKICSDLARYAMDDDSVDKAIQTRYEDAIRWLEKVSSGKVNLPDDPVAPTTGIQGVRTTPGVSFFGRTEGF